MPYLAISNFVKDNEMVRIVPVHAPKNYTADIALRKGSAKDSSLPVLIKKTSVDDDYPYLTRELARLLGVNQYTITSTVAKLKLKGDSKYHQAIRASKNSDIQRYSEAAKSKIESELAQ